MCDCIVRWIPDTDVDGSHNSRPVLCSEYTSALETVVLYSHGHTSDSLDLNDPVRTQELLDAAAKIRVQIAEAREKLKTVPEEMRKTPGNDTNEI